MTLQDAFGDIDIYLFDQLLKGRIRAGDRVLDAGCGSGRNLVYLLRQGIDVWAVDANPIAIEEARALAARLAPGVDLDRFRVASIEATGFPAASFSVVVASAVLHFARDASHFEAMVEELWRVLESGGLFFCRLASSIGMSDGMAGRLRPLGGGRFHLPDGSTRFLVDQAGLAACQARLGGQLLDPLKTTLVQDQRAMTTWVLRKG